MLCEQAGFEVDFVRPQGGYFRLIGDRIQPFYRYAFSDPKRHPWKTLLRPIYPFLKLSSETDHPNPRKCVLIYAVCQM